MLAIGGFNSTDPEPTLAEFEALVAEHEIHYYVGASDNSFGGGTGSSAITSWVAAHFKSETVGGVTVYNLTRRSKGRSSLSRGVLGDDVGRGLTLDSARTYGSAQGAGLARTLIRKAHFAAAQTPAERKEQAVMSSSPRAHHVGSNRADLRRPAGDHAGPGMAREAGGGR